MLIRALPPQTLLIGGLVNGVQVDPMTYIMHTLAERYGQLGEEVRLSAIAELFNFAPHSHERIDDLLTRFDILREPAQAEGQMHMSVQAVVWLLLQASHVSDNQLQQLLQPTHGLFPAGADQFAALQLQMRRMGHIVENAPGNIAGVLRRRHGAQHGAPTFFTGGDSNTPPLANQAATFPTAAGWGAADWSADPWATSGWQQPQWGSATQPAYPVGGEEEEWSDNGTDTDTESDL